MPLLASVVLLALAGAATPSRARQNADPIALSDAIADLASDRWSVRHRATEQLTQLGLTLKQLEGVLKRDDLSPEQRERVAQIAFARFRETPRAAMGVGFAAVTPGAEGMPIATVHAPFDSVRVLRPGDILQSVAGVSTSAPAGARPSIISFDPGDLVPIQVLRDGQPLTLSIRLGSFDDLRASTRIEASEHRAAWLIRLARIDQAAVRATPARVPIPRVAVSLHADALARGLEQPPPEDRRGMPPRTVAPKPLEQRVYFNVSGGSDRAVTSDAIDRFRLTKVDTDFENALNDVERSIAQVQNQIRTLEEAIRLEPDPRRRAALASNLAQNRQMLQGHRDKAREIESAIALEQALQAEKPQQAQQAEPVPDR
jgi:hypothetical protein